VNAPAGTPHLLPQLRRRIELVSMDRHHADISLALYATEDDRGAVVHSYSPRPGVAERCAWVAAAMRTLAGMDGGGATVGFPCGAWHERAARRAFLDACKADPAQPVGTPALALFDARTDQEVTVTPLGGGAYRVASVSADPAVAPRSAAVAAGFAKLVEVTQDPADETVIRFSCGAPHDRLVGLILPRAVNVRAALREQEADARRGVLVAPSAQEAAS